MSKKGFSYDYDISRSCYCLHDDSIEGDDGYMAYDVNENNIKFLCDKLNELIAENEALKDLNNHELQEYQNKVLSCINEEIDNLEVALNLDECSNFALDILYRLKKELR